MKSHHQALGIYRTNSCQLSALDSEWLGGLIAPQGVQERRLRFAGSLLPGARSRAASGRFDWFRILNASTMAQGCFNFACQHDTDMRAEKPAFRTFALTRFRGIVGDCAGVKV